MVILEPLLNWKTLQKFIMINIGRKDLGNVLVRMQFWMLLFSGRWKFLNNLTNCVRVIDQKMLHKQIFRQIYMLQLFRLL